MEFGSKNWSSQQMLFPGVWVYKNVFNNLNLTEKINTLLEDPTSPYTWHEARVGYMDLKSDYRNCSDFKIGEIENPKNEHESALAKIWQDAHDAHVPAVSDYCNRYSIKMDFWEVMNYIRYVPGNHFKEHADHGFSYSATVSLVGYLNDDYVGGGLYFPKLDLKIQPEAGDLYIFPSTYLFSHVALPVESGTKYSLVTMLDYNDNAHSEEYMKMIYDKVNAQNNSI
jgi:hypothetical protein